MKRYTKKGLFITLTLSLIMSVFSITGMTTNVLANEKTSTEQPLVEDNGLELNKTAKDNGDGTYTISLESYTTGTLSTITKPQPIDFVFVLDISGSMNEVFSADASKSIKKIDALVDAAQSFLTEIQADAVKYEVNHRVAMTTFAGMVSGDNERARVLGGNTMFEIWLNGSPTELAYSPKNLLRNSYPTKDASLLGDLNNSLNLLRNEAEGGTAPYIGFRTALGPYDYSPVIDDGRKKVTVLFSDGEPDNGAEDNSVRYARQIKERSASIYSVGVPTGNNVNPESKHAKMLSYFSSNYPNAKDLGNLGEQKDTKYLLWANNADELKKIFTSIYQDESKPSISLDETTKLKDIVSPYFELAKAEDIKVYASDYLGKVNGVDTWGEKAPLADAKVTLSDDKKTIDVDGFNYDENMVAINSTTQEVTGRKLVVEVLVSKKDGFMGGFDVPTNTPDAGIYVKDEVLEKFPEPKVDVPMEYNFGGTKKSIYIGSATNMNDLIDMDLTKEGVQYFDKGNNATHTVDGVNNAFVNLEYIVTDKNGNVLGKYEIDAKTNVLKIINDVKLKGLTENTEVVVNVNLKSIKTPDVTGYTNSKNSNVYVFTPEVKVKDSVIFLGEITSLSKNIDSVTWANKIATAAKPIEAEPVLSYEYKTVGKKVALPFVYSPKETARYTINVLNGVLDITNYSIIKNDKQHNDGDFEVQVVKGELKIEKAIDQQYTENASLNSDQTFKFKIDVRDSVDGEIKNTYYQTIQFSANEKATTKSITLKGLSKGYYTISEVDGWAWRYSETKEKRLDNYNTNGVIAGINENSKLFIGDVDTANTNGKKYYGSETGTMIGANDQSNAATTHFENVRNSKNILGDVASAINKFTGK